MPAARAVWPEHAGGVEAAQEGRLHVEQFRGLTHGDHRIVVVVEPS
jgi:hypothetical protein